MSYLNMFRRKPAITSSDWHFTAFQHSSENYAKGTLSFLFKTSTAYRITNSKLFHYVIQRAISTFPLQYFSLSLNLLYLALEDGSPIFQQVFSHCTYNNNNLIFYRTEYLLW